VRMAGALVASHDAELRELADRVREFVRRGRDEAFAEVSSREEEN
jgi:hypothetical protein